MDRATRSSKVVPASGGECTAGLQGAVKDPSGGVIVKATAEVASPALIGAKTTEIDHGGYYRFANLPPGVCAVKLTAAGFAGFRRENVS